MLVLVLSTEISSKLREVATLMQRQMMEHRMVLPRPTSDALLNPSRLYPKSAHAS